MMKDNKEFIEYDNHNGIILLRVCVKNALNKVYYVMGQTIELEHIPYSLIIECLYDGQLEYRWTYDTDWDDEIFIITVRSDLDSTILFTICGNVNTGKVSISNDE